MSSMLRPGILLLALGIYVLVINICLFSLVVVRGEEVFEYYGYIPTSFNYTSGLDVIPQPTPEDPNPGWRVNGTAYLDIIGYNDSTTVTVYDIARPEEPRAIAAHTINRMGNMTVRAPKGLYFKVVSNKPIAACIGGGNSYGAGSSLFYPSTDGGFAGTEFIFMAQPSYLGGEMVIPGHTIHAIEDAQVTIYDSEGKSVWNKELKANSTYSGPLFTARRVYRIVSTGRIMVANWVAGSFTVLPSMMGGYRGTRFYTKESAYTGGSENQQVFLLLTGQDQATNVKVLDPLGQTYVEKTVQPKELWVAEGKTIPFLAKNTMVMSSGPTIVFSGDMNATGGGTIYTTVRDGLTIFGIRPNEPTTFLVISEGIVFSPETNASIGIGTLLLNVPKGGYARLPAGLLTLTTNATVIVELRTPPITLASSGATALGALYTTENWATYLITPKATVIVYPPPTKEEGLGLYPITAGAVVVAVIGALIIWKKPWKR